MKFGTMHLQFSKIFFSSVVKYNSSGVVKIPEGFTAVGWAPEV
jgi:hypothetical protein